MAMNRIYERLHCVLDLIPYIFNALHKQNQRKLMYLIFGFGLDEWRWFNAKNQGLKFSSGFIHIIIISVLHFSNHLCLVLSFLYLSEDDRIKKKQDSTAPPPGVVERQHLLSEMGHWHDRPFAAGGKQTQEWCMKHSKDKCAGLQEVSIWQMH